VATLAELYRLFSWAWHLDVNLARVAEMSCGGGRLTCE
jgi:hypothetical protein